MTLRPLAAIAVLGVLAFSGASVPALAATAHASDKITIFGVPRGDYSRIVGLLQAGEEVTLDRCTSDGRWCRVLHNGPTGWVPASYLVGAAAKLDATVGRPLTDPDLGRPER